MARGTTHWQNHHRPAGRTLGRGALVLVLCLLGGGLGADPLPRPAESLAFIVADLKDIEAEMLSNQQRIEALQNRIGELQVLGKDAEGQIQNLQALVETHAARVQQLGERYSRVLVVAQNLKRDLEWSHTLNWVLGGTALVAVAVAVGEGIALGSR